jgi:hypothetical protein
MLEALHLIELDRDSGPCEGKIPQEISVDQMGLSRQESDLASDGRAMDLEVPRRSTLSHVRDVQMPEGHVYMPLLLHEAGITGCERACPFTVSASEARNPAAF